MGLEPEGAEAKRTVGRGPLHATGAPSSGVADTEGGVNPTGGCLIEELRPRLGVLRNFGQDGLRLSGKRAQKALP